MSRGERVVNASEEGFNSLRDFTRAGLVFMSTWLHRETMPATHVARECCVYVSLSIDSDISIRSVQEEQHHQSSASQLHPALQLYALHAAHHAIVHAAVGVTQSTCNVKQN